MRIGGGRKKMTMKLGLGLGLMLKGVFLKLMLEGERALLLVSIGGFRSFSVWGSFWLRVEVEGEVAFFLRIVSCYYY